MKHVESVKGLQTLLKAVPISLAYFGTQKCDVCHATRPKVEDLLSHYPTVESFYCPVDANPEFSGQYLVFAVPAVLVFDHGNETFRNARFIDLERLKNVLNEIVE